MRKHLWKLILLAACALELYAATPAVYGFGNYSGGSTIVENPYYARRKRRQRRVVSIGVGALLLVVGGTFVALNLLDKRAKRRDMLLKQLERQQRGLM